MSRIEKIKRVVLIALGFGLATYLIMSGFAILNKEGEAQNENKEIVTD
jgi:hypothetical protein